MTISVALATYNGARFLTEQLESILEQELPVNEIVVCDDGSADATWEIIKRYHAEHPQVFRIYQTSKNLGVIKNFEKSINLCTGDIIFLSDQDDIWRPNKTQRIAEIFANDKRTDAIFHNLTLTQNNETLVPTLWDTLFFDAKIQNLSAEQLVVHTLLVTNVLTGAACAFRRTELSFATDSKLLHDAQLLLHYTRLDRLKALDETLGYYRLHDAQQVSVNINSPSLLQYKLKTVYNYTNFYDLYCLYHTARKELGDSTPTTPALQFAEKVLIKWYRQQLQIYVKQRRGIMKYLVLLKWRLK